MQTTLAEYREDLHQGQDMVEKDSEPDPNVGSELERIMCPEHTRKKVKERLTI